ncbi:MAG: hypothetical protein SNJ78_12140 [Spirochaetales bacterium]
MRYLAGWMVLLGVLLCSQAGGYTLDTWRSSLDAEVEIPGDTAARWILELPASRVFYLERRKMEEETPYRRFGLCTPFLMVGPVDLLGLLREARYPLGYGLSGTVFQEQTGLALYAGKEIKRRSGISIQDPSHILSLGAFSDLESPPHVFIAVRLPTFLYNRNLKGDTYFIPPVVEGFLSFTHAPEKPVESVWFSSKPSMIAGVLTHWGGRVTLGLEGDISTSCTISVVSSHLSHEEAGAYVHLYGRLSVPFAEMRSLTGYSTASYVTPEGSKAFRLGQQKESVTFYPYYPFLLGIEAEQIVYREGEEEKNTRVWVGVQSNKMKFLLNWKSLPKETEVSLETWVKVGRFTLSVDVSRDYTQTGYLTTFALSGSYSGTAWGVEWEGKGTWKPDFEVQGGGNLFFKARNWKLEVGIKIRKPLGFEPEYLLPYSQNPFAYWGGKIAFSTWESHRPNNNTSSSKERP